MEIALELDKRYTFADYLTWMDDKMRELLNGFIKMMSPAPTASHQKVNIRLAYEMIRIIKKHKGKCEVFHAPFDVRLPKNGEKDDDKIDTVVQPDLCVICDPSKIDERGCLGAPDLIVEVQSAATAKYDLNDKFNIYEAAGVKEYWVVFPYEKSIVKFVLQADGKYDKGTKFDTGTIPVGIFEDESIDLKEVF
ncbi:MAG: Uma2 family endonuclease [Dysgonamonadaceae bacterium]|jgi:Uma2 family endonuclease|nr:Uma2 family endonuclease [Dysgonamonadaceae bacterium]